uniref:ShKT domain-containing protein n=1 Tax=Dracunculus medinensis TaxID=318479 RepID=A0A0N4UPR5_DRAME
LPSDFVLQLVLYAAKLLSSAPQISVVNNCTLFADNPALCNSPQLSAFALERCAKTCGLCDKPGSAGGCPDTNENCNLLRNLHSCNDTFMQQNCQRTCGLKNCLGKAFFILNVNFLILNEILFCGIS